MRSNKPILAIFVLALPGSLLACADAPLRTGPQIHAVGAAPFTGEEATPALAEAAVPLPAERKKPHGAAYPAPHPSMPQIPRNGGDVLHDPSVVTVTFPDDPLEDKIDAFADQVGSLSWWSTVHADYGVGPATNAGHVTIADAPPRVIKDSEIQAWIQARITDGTLPAPTDQTIYTLYYPASTTVRIDPSQGGGASCQVFLGYHSAFDVTYQGQATTIAYAVVNRCGDLDMLTVTASHELTEASTDPHPIDSSTAGYITLDDNAWTVLGGENGDMCAGVSSTTEAGWTLTRVWSNSAAARGDQPCVPTPDSGGVPFYDAGIVKESLLARRGTTVSTEVDCYAFGALPAPMTLSALPANSPGPLKFSFDRSTCNDGDKVTMSITVASTAQRGADYHYTLLAKLDEQHGHIWRGLVHVQ